MNALIVIGSPKGRASASFTLGSALSDALRKRGATVCDGFAHQALRSPQETARLLDAFDAADLVVLAFPLYVDSLPAPLVRLLELVAARRGPAPATTPRLAAVVQCGFPEASQCDTAVAICRLFAERTGMRWAGALRMGMGGQLGGGIGKLPDGGRHIVQALDMAAGSLEDGGAIPGHAAALFAKPLVPRWLYTLIGNLGWRIQMRKHKAQRPIGFRPYAQDQPAFLTGLLLRRRIRACLLRCARSGSSTHCQVRLRGPRSRALHPHPSPPPRDEPR